MTDEFREIVDFPPVVLEAKCLFELERVLTEGMTIRTPARFLLGDGARRTTRTSIADLVDAAKPQVYREFGAEVTSWSASGDIEAGVSLTLYHNYAQAQIHALSETRYLGKKQQLDDFFQEHRPWYARWLSIFNLAGSVLVLLLMLGAVFLYARRSPILGSVALASAMLMGVFTWAVITNRLFPFVRIDLRQRSRAVRPLELVTLIVGLVGTLSTVVSVILQIKG